MDVHETAVEHFLTANGKAFVCPQITFECDSNSRRGGAEPDFFVLEFAPQAIKNDAAIVEVSAAYNIDGLMDRLEERESRWLLPARKCLERASIGHLFDRVRVIAFVRAEFITWCEERIAPADSNVTFFPIERAMLAYEWWDYRQQGLPNSSDSGNYWFSEARPANIAKLG